MANPGYEPGTEAALLRQAGVAIFAIGIGSAVNLGELQTMASSPQQEHIYLLKSFQHIGDIVDTMAATTCQQPAAVSAGVSVSSALAPCGTAFFQPTCGTLNNTIVELTDTTGSINLYVARNVSNPSQALNDFHVEGSATLKRLIVNRTTSSSNNNNNVYVGLLNTATNRNTSFQLSLWSDIFQSSSGGSGSGSATVAVSEAASVGQLLYTPPPVNLGNVSSAVTYSIVSGNEEGVFAISSSTGRLTLAKALDYESRTSYQLRITAKAVALPCLSGVVSLLVNVVDADDNGPIFSQSVYQATLPEGTALGTTVVRILATDADSGDFGRVTYSIVSGDSQALALDSVSGIVSTRAALDYETASSLVLLVRATSTTRSVQATVILNVTAVSCPAGQASATGTLPCTACQAGQTYQDGSTPKGCQPCGCPSNTYSSGSCTASRNVDCLACPSQSSSPGNSTQLSNCTCNAGHYRQDSSGGGSFSCVPCTSSCPAGQYLSGSCTPTSNPVCRPCTSLSSCGPNAYLQGSCGGSSNFVCATCKTCGPGTYISQPCGTNSDRVCSACRTYNSSCQRGTQYLSHNCQASNTPTNPTCEMCISSCGSEEFLTGVCGGGSDGTSSTQCQRCQQCSSIQYDAAPCTATSDRVCSNCISQCPTGQYLVGQCGVGRAPPTCQNCTKSSDCGTNQYLDSTACGGQQTPACQDCDSSCASCSGAGPNKCLSCGNGLKLLNGRCVSSCGAGQVDIEGVCQPCDSSCVECSGLGAAACSACNLTAGLFLFNSRCVNTAPAGYYKDVNAGVIRQCSLCPSGQYASGGCLDTRDTVCSSCSTACESGVKYEAVACTHSSNRLCLTCRSSCPAGQELTGACVSADRQCSACQSGQYKATVGSQSCQSCATGCAASEYLSGTCNATSSPVCRSCLTQCSAGEYLSGECDGSRSQPECKPCTSCSAGQYARTACSSSDGGKDTVCANCTSRCPTGSYMAQPCSPHQDAQCSLCRTASDCALDEVLLGTCNTTSNPTCAPCHPDCRSCSGQGPNQCLTCPRGLSFHQGSCLTDCPTGKYKSEQSDGQSVCLPCDDSCGECVGPSSSDCTACSSGSYLHNGVCLTACPTGKYGNSGSHTCENCRICGAGTFATGGCDDGVRDTVCQSCRVCNETQYEILSCTATRNRQCATCTSQCGPGLELKGQCGGTDGRQNPQCEACASGYYKTESGSGSCQACLTTCPVGRYLSGSCLSTAGPQCLFCKSSCPAGSYLSGTCGGRSDYACTPCTTCTSGTEYETRACESSGQDRQCAQCRSSCLSGFYLSGDCGGVNGTSNPVCQACRTASDCGTSQYLTGSCGGNSNPTCADCHPSCAQCTDGAATSCTACPASTHLENGRCVSECQPGAYEEGAKCTPCDGSCADCNGAGASACVACASPKFLWQGQCLDQCPGGTFERVIGTDRSCQSCSTCTQGSQYLSGGCSGSSDSICLNVTDCPTGQYQSVAATVTSDRICTACRIACPAGQQLSGNCTTGSDRVCVSCQPGTFKAGASSANCQTCLSSCATGYYMTGSCTATSQPQCLRCTQSCAAGNFLVGTCGQTSNPSCEVCQTCAEGEFETRACTSSSDRQCSSCVTADDCKAGEEYLSGQCTAVTSPRCMACLTVEACNAQQYLKGSCTVDGPAPTCTSCTTCAADEYEVAPCTRTSDRRCAKCVDTCVSGQYLVGSCPGPVHTLFPRTVVKEDVTYAVLDAGWPSSTDFGCQSQRLPLPAGWSLAADIEAATAVAALHSWGTGCLVLNNDLAVPTGHDLAPANCSCGTGGCLSQTVGGMVPAHCARRILVARMPPACQDCTASCDEGSFLSGTCGGRSDYACRPCRQCQNGEYETTPCTHLSVGTQDRVCAACTNGESEMGKGWIMARGGRGNDEENVQRKGPWWLGEKREEAGRGSASMHANLSFCDDYCLVSSLLLWRWHLFVRLLWRYLQPNM